MTAREITRSSPSAPQRLTDPFDAMRHEIDSVLERFGAGLPTWPVALGRGIARDALVPELDVHDDGKQLMIDVDLPGVEEKDVSVTLANGMLTIKGEKKSEREEKKDDYYMAERSYGSFERTLRLPETVDESRIEARFDKGVLKVVAQKRPEAIKAEKRIEVKKG